MVRYIVHQILVTEGVENILPFSIQLPNDCKNVIGVSVTSDAQLSTLVEDQAATPILSGTQIEEGLQKLQLTMRNRGVIPSVLKYTSDYAGTPVQWPPINIGKSKLATVNFRVTGSYIAELNLLPNRFRLIFRNDDFGLVKSSNLALPQLSRPVKKFLPVSVQGSEREIQGWVSLTKLGLSIDEELALVNFNRGEDKVNPYLISIILKYTTE